MAGSAFHQDIVENNAPGYPEHLEVHQRAPSIGPRLSNSSRPQADRSPSSRPRINLQRAPLLLLLGVCAENAQKLASELRSQYRVVISSSAEFAQKALKGQHPDLVVAEHRAGETSRSSSWMARKFGLQVPVLYLVTHDTLPSDWDEMGIEGTEFVVAPVVPQLLFARVRTLLRLKRQADLLRDVAGLDQSTLIANRSRFEAQLELEWRAAMREKTTLGVVLVSVDHFKGFVRRSGHQTGEEALCALVQVLCNSLRRPRDFVARFGREEFALLLPGSDEEAALHTASYLCEQVARSRLPFCGSTRSAYLSISAGAASTVPGLDSNPRRLMKVVDDHLYVAMMSGRNQARNGSQSTKPPTSEGRVARGK